VALKKLIGRVLSAIWTGANGVRKVLHLLLLLFIFLLFFDATSEPPHLIPRHAALVIQPVGFLVEQYEGEPFERAVAEMLGDGRPQTLVQDIVDALEFAKDDDRIDVVYLELSRLFGGGLSKLQRIGVAIDDFRSSGKTVLANADFMSQQSYYLAAYADEAYLHPDGLLFIRGYGSFKTYYKDVIDLLRIDWNIFRVGTHKSYVEPYERMNMSDEDRETNIRLIDQLWQQYRFDIVAARNLEDGAIDSFATDYLNIVKAADGDAAIAARDYGLIDKLLTRTEVRNVLIDYVGEDPDEPDTFNATEMAEYLAQMRMLSGSKAKDENIAIVVAAGEIQFGSQPPGTIGGDSTAALLRRARNDDSIKAVVFRIDSPGGSVFAAEVIRDEVIALRESGKPVVASMGSVAASGGYSIAMNADHVVASPATITGSIGVIGMFPTYQRTLAAIGIRTDGVGSTPFSGELRPDREMSEHTKELFQLFVEDTYDDFITDVADSRAMDKEAVDEVAQGKVWTGIDALSHGLVDQLGSFEDALLVAADLADLEEGHYGLKSIEQKMSPGEQLLVDIIGTAAKTGLDLSGWVRQPSALEELAGSIAEKTKSMLRFNDPKGIYSHCFCDID
jgi:protease-4